MTYFLLNSGLYFIPTLFLVPIAQWLLWRIDKHWVVVPMAGLMFLPAWLDALIGFNLVSGQTPPLERWEVVHLASEGNTSLLLQMSTVAMVSLGLWKLFSLFPGNNLRGKKVQALPVGRTFALMLFLAWVACAPLSHYKSLQFAVETDDISLATRRLEFNLEGLGPNDGKITSVGTHGLLRSPLLPVAVKNNSKEMVELLLKYGAKLNPDGANDAFRANSSFIDLSALAVAIQNENMDMLGFLIDKGANPTEGIRPAVLEDKPEVFQFLVLRGADVDIARKDFVSAKALEALDQMRESISLPPT